MFAAMGTDHCRQCRLQALLLKPQELGQHQCKAGNSVYLHAAC